MRLVDRPVIRPMHCAAIPHRGQTAVGERWVDTGVEMPGFDNHVYLSETAVREAGRLLDHPTPEAHADLAELGLRLEGELEEAHARIAYLEDMLHATATVEQYLNSLGDEPEPEDS